MIKKAVAMLKRQGADAFGHLVREKLHNRLSEQKKYERYIAQYEPMFSEEERTLLLKHFSIDKIVLGENLYGRLSECRGDWVVFCEEQSVFSEDFEAAAADYVGRNPQAAMFYTDEDCMLNGRRRYPVFKPDWSPDTYLDQNYIGSCMAVRASLAKQIAREMSGTYQNGWIYDFGLRVTEKLEAEEIGHIDRVLYHRVLEKEENPARTPVSAEYLCKMKEQAICRREKGNVPAATAIAGAKAYVEAPKRLRENAADCADSAVRVAYRLKENADGQLPLVSLIVPSKDNPQLLKTCMDSVENYSTYENVEWIIVDNGSSAKNQNAYRELLANRRFPCVYKVEERPFNFSFMCNLGAKHAGGEFLLFLNDDIELPEESGDWLERLCGQAALPHVGAVGAKLLYPNSRSIQHLGVVNYTTGAAHLLWQQEDCGRLPFERNRTTQNYAVVTGACLCVKADKFREVGGFEERLAVTFNDVAFCLEQLRRKRMQVVRPDVMLYHHESITRGIDSQDAEKEIRNLQERELLYDLFPEYVGVDPFYSRHLTQKRLDHTLDYVTRPALVKAEKITGQKETAADVRKLQIIKDNTVSLDSAYGGSGKGQSGFHCRIERITVEREVTMEGWAFCEGVRSGCTHLLLKGTNGTVYKIPVRKTYTPTLNTLFQTEQNLYMAGFESRFAPPQAEKKNRCQVYAVIADRAYDTGRNVML